MKFKRILKHLKRIACCNSSHCADLPDEKDLPPRLVQNIHLDGAADVPVEAHYRGPYKTSGRHYITKGTANIHRGCDSENSLQHIPEFDLQCLMSGLSMESGLTTEDFGTTYQAYTEYQPVPQNGDTLYNNSINIILQQFGNIERIQGHLISRFSLHDALSGNIEIAYQKSMQSLRHLLTLGPADEIPGPDQVWGPANDNTPLRGQSPDTTEEPTNFQDIIDELEYEHASLAPIIPTPSATQQSGFVHMTTFRGIPFEERVERVKRKGLHRYAHPRPKLERLNSADASLQRQRFRDLPRQRSAHCGEPFLRACCMPPQIQDHST
ncbi:hypothetical protein TWF718_006596 [Orbilia javanica]|uniref:Uncharacterized protein n=1 Tax=Orbilia javanica TaxID=47235 RepID=A0AAN8RN06_9PEZI